MNAGVWLRCERDHRWMSGLYQGRVIERDCCPFCGGVGEQRDEPDALDRIREAVEEARAA